MTCNKDFLSGNAEASQVTSNVLSIHNHCSRAAINVSNDRRKQTMKRSVNRRPNARPQDKRLLPKTRRQVCDCKSESSVNSGHNRIVVSTPKLGNKDGGVPRSQHRNAAKVFVAELSRARAMIFLPVPLTSIGIEKKIHIAASRQHLKCLHSVMRTKVRHKRQARQLPRLSGEIR